MTDNRVIFETVRPWLDAKGFTPDRIAALDAAIAGEVAPEPTRAENAQVAPFDRWLPHILKHEGGYVNHPKDPGGATNKGIIQRTYDSWCDRQGQPRQSVRNITDAEVAAIYRRDYWDAVKGDDLPAGVDYCVFDFAVNSGINRAAKYLQGAVSVAQDGKIGPATIAAVKAKQPAAIINEICNSRMAFLRGLATFPTFGKGWTRRVEEVRSLALGAAG